MPTHILPRRMDLATGAYYRLLTDEVLRQILSSLSRDLAGVAEDTATGHLDLDPAQLAEIIASTADHLQTQLTLAEAEMGRRLRLRARGCPIEGDTFPPAFLADLKARLPLDAVVESELGAVLGPPNRGGVRSGVCPIRGCGGHSGSEPFKVYPRKWLCYSCGERGDAFSAMQIGRGLSFVEAVRALAERAGLPLPVGVRRD